MYTEWDVYIAFRKAQSNFKNRPYKLPKDWESKFQSFSKQNQDALTKAAQYFSTKWHNIDIDKFMKLGFELFEHKFTYTKFFDNRLLNYYINRDKNEKRNIQLSKQKIIESAKWIKEYMKQYNGNGSLLLKYCNMHNNNQKVAVEHYLKGYIDGYFLAWLVHRGYLQLQEIEKNEISYANLRKIKINLESVKDFMFQVENNI